MRRYDVVFIALSNLSDADISEVIERYQNMVTERKGLTIKVEKWGKKRLAYKIKKQGRGFYVFTDFGGVSETVSELERNLKIDDRILKYMTVVTAQNVDPEALQKEISAAKEAAEAAERQKAEGPAARQEIQPATAPATVSEEAQNLEEKGDQK